MIAFLLFYFFGVVVASIIIMLINEAEAKDGNTRFIHLGECKWAWFFVLFCAFVLVATIFERTHED